MPAPGRGPSYPAVRNLSPAEHEALVRRLFARVPRGYDFLNHLLSLRRDIAWRRAMVRTMALRGAPRVLDVAAGTGDVGVEVCRACPGAAVTAVDFVPEMLLPSRPKSARAGIAGRIRPALGDALHLPFPDASFDAATVAFGVRNMPDRVAALREMGRTLGPGGGLYVLEMVPPENALYRLYLTRLLPGLARRFTPDPAAYHYLADSILAFPRPDDFLSEMAAAGLAGLQKRRFTFGITYLFWGTKAGVRS
jgi:demethylmenaquinone methyltransferase/2-methoxy-6-polyprenyl-1,4-benzoquinol methylase